MGNSLGGKKTTKIMKIDGETFKLKTPVTAEEVLRDYPGHVLLESESVKHYGARAKPLEAKQMLKAKRLYFVVEPVKECPPRRARSVIHMTAQERLENLMLARRSSSDISALKPPGKWKTKEEEEEEGGAARVKLRIPKAEIERLVKEGATEAEATQKIAALFMAKKNHDEARQKTLQRGVDGGDEPASAVATAAATRGVKSCLKRVSFMAEKGGNEITVA
ncbi:unnamed protein product [Eruca vesicaria subsp. sativa]|uniref:Plastid movement impaired 2 n=1 Tax=Eruca vesicaria subsp. sativa TaxID=29727 RepID=A0ABC8LLE7_ERUVS|nr:unnamed protein product [Eruca vesicaria subsp. sativa]